MVGYHRTSNLFNTLSSLIPNEIINKEGILADAFPSNEMSDTRQFKLSENPKKVSDTFNLDGGKSPFLNSGFMINGKVVTQKLEADYNGKSLFLRDIIDDDNDNIDKVFH